MQWLYYIIIQSSDNYIQLLLIMIFFMLYFDVIAAKLVINMSHLCALYTDTINILHSCVCFHFTNLKNLVIFCVLFLDIFKNTKCLYYRNKIHLYTVDDFYFWMGIAFILGSLFCGPTPHFTPMPETRRRVPAESRFRLRIDRKFANFEQSPAVTIRYILFFSALFKRNCIGKKYIY